jgi:hypothetical protein
MLPYKVYMGACYTKAEVKAAKAEVTVRKPIPVALAALPIEPVAPVAPVAPAALTEPLPESLVESLTESVLEPTSQDPIDLEEQDPPPNAYHVYSGTLLGLLLVAMVFFVSN